MNLRVKFLLLITSCLLAAGCGSPGEPLPPSLELPRPVTDLRATRKGNDVTLTWTAPTLTTEGRTITQSGSFEICRAQAQMQQCGAAVAHIPFGKTSRANTASSKETYVDTLSSSTLPGDARTNFHYTINTVNSYGRSAGLSNQVEVPSAPTIAAPVDLQAQVTADGIHLSWQAVANLPQAAGLHFLYRVYRREQGVKTDVTAGEVPIGDASPTLLDRSFEWEKTYDYWITVVSSVDATNGSMEQVEGDNSSPVQVVAHDVFPPATPTGLQAVFSGPGQTPFIDLVWNANTEPDLAGYNIYRHEEGMPARKINVELVKTPAFRDGTAVACVTYFYSVSAVDVRSNESPRSEEARQGSTCDY